MSPSVLGLGRGKEVGLLGIGKGNCAKLGDRTVAQTSANRERSWPTFINVEDPEVSLQFLNNGGDPKGLLRALIGPAVEGGTAENGALCIGGEWFREIAVVVRIGEVWRS